jgi:hypothetical protein
MEPMRPAAVLNRDLHCVTIDRDALAQELSAELAPLLAAQPNLFASAPVFLGHDEVAAMQDVVAAVAHVTALPAWEAAVAAWLPGITHPAFGPRGVFFGYDFHLGDEGPKLIEVNTNAGGAMLNLALARAQRACCTEVRPLMNGPYDMRFIEELFVEMFRKEWRLQRGDAALGTIAIVDDAPQGQFLYPEFVLFRQLFERAGIAAVIGDAAELRFHGGTLALAGRRIDLVYNRLTDFYFSEEPHAALRDAYLAGAAVVTPHPRAFGLAADKRNLTLLSDAAFLAALDLDAATRAALSRGIPRTLVVTAANADELWRDRRKYFFKPMWGFGSKAAYRGDKLTKGTWAEILTRDYVAQALVHPSERMLEHEGKQIALKIDVRNYAYDGQVQFLAARLYQGQTTNFRTPGGGFAPVYTAAVGPLAG